MAPDDFIADLDMVGSDVTRG